LDLSSLPEKQTKAKERPGTKALKWVTDLMCFRNVSTEQRYHYQWYYKNLFSSITN